MGKVTRTVKAVAIRYEENGNIITMTYPVLPISAVKTLMDAMKITDYKWGYMPVTYEMSEEAFLAKAVIKSNVEEGTIYATKEECPGTTVAHKSDKATS